jgi:hypothetical protein
VLSPVGQRPGRVRGTGLFRPGRVAGRALVRPLGRVPGRWRARSTSRRATRLTCSARRRGGGGAASVGYLLNDRVADVGQFVEALTRVAAGRPAPSTAQVRSDQPAARATSCSACAADARTRTSPSGSSVGPIAAAVCDALCGLTLIIITAINRPLLRQPGGTTAASAGSRSCLAGTVGA